MISDREDLFLLAATDDAEAVNRILQSGTSPDDRDSFGRTALHICCTRGCAETAAVLLKWNANTSLQDFENGWTPLHRSLYFGHLKITLLLLKAGAKLGDDFTRDNFSIDVECKWEKGRSLRTHHLWKSPIDHDGNSPLDLLSLKLSPFLRASSAPPCTEVVTFGKADFFLGVPLPHSQSQVTRPRPIAELSLEVPITDIAASRFHSAAVTSDGQVFTWGLGRAGRLGHGDEVTQPLPLPIRGFPENVRIVQVAAAETHMLAVDSRGGLFSWGANRFGQLGRGPSKGRGNQSTTASWEHNFSPQRVDRLRRQRVCGVAAGDSHSICCTLEGDVWTWGSNKEGQLGYRLTSTESGLGAPGCSTPALVTALRRPDGAGCSVLQVCASRGASLALLRPLHGHGIATPSVRMSTEVYQWGHGSYTPSRVLCQHAVVSDLCAKDGPAWSRATASDCITQIAAGDNHFVGISASTGFVYTWGLGAAQLGHGGREKAHASRPQVVTQLLPEHGGGRAVYVSATGDRTCVVTDCGDLFTWGSSGDPGVLGLGPGKYQPTPKRVVGIKRAVRVALGSDHTLVLLAASVPPLPYALEPASGGEGGAVVSQHDNEPEKEKRESGGESPLKLKELAERRIAQCVTLRDVVSALSFADFYDAKELSRFCVDFILRNLDAVFMQLLNSAGHRARSNTFADLEPLVGDLEEAASRLALRPVANSCDEAGRRVSVLQAAEVPSAHTAVSKVVVLPSTKDAAQRQGKSLRKRQSKLQADTTSAANHPAQEMQDQTNQLMCLISENDSTAIVTTESANCRPPSAAEGCNQSPATPSECSLPVAPFSSAQISGCADGGESFDREDVTRKQKERKKSKKKFVPLSLFEPTTPPPTAPPSTKSVTGSPWKVPASATSAPSLSEYMQLTESPRQPGRGTGGDGVISVRSEVCENLSQVTSAASAPAEVGAITLCAFIGASRRVKQGKGAAKRSHIPIGASADTATTPAKPRSTSCPWVAPVREACVVDATHSTEGKTRLRDIQQEEEAERARSSMQQLQGHSSPWFVDRRNSRAQSLEDVMRCQQEAEEQAKLRAMEEREIQDAIAAVEEMERRGAQVKNNKRRQRRKKQPSF